MATDFHPRKQKTFQHFPNKECSPWSFLFSFLSWGLWITGALQSFSLRQEKETQTQTFGSGYPLVGWGSFLWRGGGRKVRYVPRNQGDQTFVAGYPGILPGYPGGARKVWEKKIVFNQFSFPTNIRKNPHAHKNKIGTSTPPLPKKPRPPLKGGILWASGFSSRKNQKMPGAHKIGAATSGPRIAGGNFMDITFFFLKHVLQTPSFGFTERICKHRHTSHLWLALGETLSRLCILGSTQPSRQTRWLVHE